MISATIDEVFVRDPYEPKYLGETKAEAVALDGYRFHLSPKITSLITMSLDPSDGGYYALLIGMFIDGIEAAFTTGWISNYDEKRTREYTLEIPKHPVKMMQPGRVHRVQFMIGARRTVFGIPLPALPPRVYDLAESEVYYYTIGKVPDGNNTGAPSSGTSGSGGIDPGADWPHCNK